MMQFNYNKKMFTGRVKPFRIIDNPDDLRLDKLSSAVLEWQGTYDHQWETE
jgi:hypothetical protein